MNIKNMIEKFKSNKLNYATKYSAIIFAVVYFLAVVILIVNRFSLINILSMSANYVTIVSCVLVLIQLIAFVRDSRQKEFRSRKEYALTLAKEYANELLVNMTYINTVLSIHYNDKDMKELENVLNDIEINFFTKDYLGRNKKLSKHENVFKDGNYLIDFNTIVDRAVIHQVNGFDDISKKIIEAKQKEVANMRFKSLVSTTMNNLEYFAMSVNQNVADSDMLFVSLHQTYLKFVKYMYPTICKSNKNGESYYTYVIDLYRKWDKKQEEFEELKKKKENEIQEELRKSTSPQALLDTL